MGKGAHSRIQSLAGQHFDSRQDRRAAIVGLRAYEFARASHKRSFEHDGIGIEIHSINAVPNGIDVFAQAWQNGRQIGFGADGSVDIERFHIGNPPLLVPDADGNINPHGRPLREDAHAALREILAHTILHVGQPGSPNIEPGKRGRTTFTFFSSNDGYVSSTGAIYSTARGAGGAKILDTTNGAVGQADIGSGSDRFQCYQAFVDWGDIATVNGTLTSATAFLYLAGDSTSTDFTVEMREQGYLTIGTSDFIAGASLSGFTRIASRSTAGLGAGYNALTSDAAFMTYIAAMKTQGIMPVNISSSRQAGNNSPTGDEFFNFEVSTTDLDGGGTTTDPKLVIVAAAAPSAGFFMNL